MAQMTVTNVVKASKEIKGKPCDVIKITLVGDRGPKTYDVLKFDKLYNAVAVLNAGDVCEVKMVQNGQYWNLGSVTRTGSGGDVSAPQKAAAPTSGSGGFKKSPEDQLSIIRQNVNDKAMQFVIGMLQNGVYGKKVTPDMMFEEVKRFAKKMEAYASLKDDYSQLDGFASTEEHIDSSMLED